MGGDGFWTQSVERTYDIAAQATGLVPSLLSKPPEVQPLHLLQGGPVNFLSLCPNQTPRNSLDRLTRSPGAPLWPTSCILGEHL